MALWVQALLCGTLALFLYYHTLKFHYTLDDLASIQENPDVSLETSFEQLWTNDYWGNSMLSLDTHGSYRPLTIISFRWTYWLVQLYTNTTNLDDTINSNDFVFYLHLGNVLLHGVASMLVVVLSHDLIHSSHWESPFRSWLPLWAGALFAAHPVHVEAVANISGRADILACIFFTSALVLWLRALSCTSLTWRRFLLTAAQVIGVCGALSKESALAVFGVMIIHFGIFLLNRRPKTLQKRRPKERGASHSAAGPTLFLSFSLLIAPLMSLGLFFLIRARLILLVPINRMSYYDNPLMFEWSEHGFLHRLLYAMGVWTEYMRLLLFPRSMAYDYSLQVLPDMEIPQLASSDIIKVATAVITIVSGLFATKTRSSAFCTCFAMLIGPLIPLLSLFFPVGTIVAERTLYTPSVAYVLMVVLTLDFVLRNVRDVGGLDRIFPRGCGEGFSSALTTSTAPPSSSLQEGSSTFLRRRRKVETTSSQHSLPPSSHRSRDLLRQVPALSQIDCSTKSGTEATSRYRRVGLGTAFITVLTLLYCQRCYQVSSAWENNESLYLSGPLLQPYSCKVWSNAGYQFKQLGRNLEAAACTYRAYQLCSWDIAFKMDAAVSHYRLNMLDLTKKLYISAANSDCKQWRYHRKRNSCMSTKEKVYRTLIGFLHKHGSQEEVRVYQEQWKKSVVSYRKEMDL